MADPDAVDWRHRYLDYLLTSGCPMDAFGGREAAVARPEFGVETFSWLLGRAVRRMYAEKGRELNAKSSAMQMDGVALGDNPPKRSKMTSGNPIENLECNITLFLWYPAAFISIMFSFQFKVRSSKKAFDVWPSS